MKTKLPKLSVHRGIEIENQSYSDAFEDVKKGHFLDKQYLVLPYLPKQKSIAGKTIYIPRLNERGVDSLENSLKGKSISTVEYDTLLENSFESFWQDCTIIFGIEKLVDIRKIDIEITKVGFGGRFFFKDLNKRELVVRLRIDMPPQQILSLILMGVLSKIGYKVEYTWEEKAAIREWIKESTVLSKYFPYHFSMLKGLRNTKQQAKYTIDSKEYCKELGLSPEITIESSVIIINNKEVLFTEKENKLFTTLYLNRGKVVDYDTLFTEVWGDDIDSFSLYSISKLVQRLRDKLVAQNLPKSLIQAYKGRGYYIR